MHQLEEEAELGGTPPDRGVKSNGTEEASALLNGTEAAAEARWAALSDADLDAEIEAFRRGITDVSKELQSLGVAVSIDEAQPETQAGPEDAEVCSPAAHVL